MLSSHLLEGIMRIAFVGSGGIDRCGGPLAKTSRSWRKALAWEHFNGAGAGAGDK